MRLVNDLLVLQIAEIGFCQSFKRTNNCVAKNAPMQLDFDENRAVYCLCHFDERRRQVLADPTDSSLYLGQQPPARKSLPPFEGLRAFDAVARLGGVRKAAKWLDRDHAVLSRHLRKLEEWVGIALIERVPTGLVLTEAGKDYHASIAKSLDAISYATLDLMNQGIHHQLMIWSTPGFAQQWLSRRLASLEKANKGVEIELKPSVTEPDFLSHEANADIRFWSSYEDLDELPAHLRHQTFAESPIIPVASPDYLERHPEITSPSDLLAHQLLHENTTRTWELWLTSLGVDCGSGLKGPRLWQGNLTTDAARDGRGIALTNPMVASKHLSRGDLVWIGKDNPAFPPRPGYYVLIARRDRWDEASLRRFRTWLAGTVAKDMPELVPAA